MSNLRALNGVAEYYRCIIPHLKRTVRLVVTTVDAWSDLSDIRIPAYGLRAPWWSPEVDWVVPPRSALDHVLSDTRPDLVHVTDSSPLALYGVAAAHRRNIPVCATFHTDLIGFSRDARAGLGLRYGARFLQSHVYGRARFLATPGSSAADVLARITGAAREQVTILGSGVDANRFHRASSTILQVGTPVRVLTVSRLSPEKHVERLLRAHQAVAAETGSQLLVVGRGPSARRLSRLAGASADFAGALEGDALVRAYQSADLFALAGPYETLPQVLLEAQATGLPCVVTQSGGAREAIVPGMTGLVAADDSAAALGVEIRRLALDPAQRGRMSSAARAWAMDLTWKHAAARLSDWYRKCVEAGAEG